MSDINFVVDKEHLTTTISRVLDAPRELVWKAHTDATLIEQWWGPRKYQTIVVTLEPKVGGAWKFINKADSEEYVFYGEFKELQEPKKITWTFIFAPYPESVITETITFEALPDGKTKITTISHYPSKEALDGMVQSGMEMGATESWERLNELITDMK